MKRKTIRITESEYHEHCNLDKELRIRTNIGLREAKSEVEYFMDNKHWRSDFLERCAGRC